MVCDKGRAKSGYLSDVAFAVPITFFGPVLPVKKEDFHY
jgi:hypothetical protein